MKTKPSLEELGRIAAASVETTRVERRLKLTIGGHTYYARDGDVLGRLGTVAAMELAQIETISRHHATFQFSAGSWKVTVPESVLNSTRLDGTEIPRGRPVPLLGKHSLMLGPELLVTVEVQA